MNSRLNIGQFCSQQNCQSRIPDQVGPLLFHLLHICAGFRKLVQWSIYGADVFRRDVRETLSSFFPLHPYLLYSASVFQGIDGQGCSMADYRNDGRHSSLREFLRRLVCMQGDGTLALFRANRSLHNHLRWFYQSTPNIHLLPFYQHVTKKRLVYSCATWFSNKKTPPTPEPNSLHSGMDGKGKYLLGGEIGGDVAGDGLLLGRIGSGSANSDQERDLFAKSGMLFGIDLGKFLHELIKNRHGGSPFYRLIRRALIQYRQPDVVVFSRRWVRAGKVFNHLVGSTFNLLWGSFLRHLLYFVMSVWSILQIKINCTQYLAVQRTAIILRALLQFFKQLVFCKSECKMFHVAIISQQYCLVKRGA